MDLAIIFDDRIRPDTTGVYMRIALRKLCRVTHLLPEEATANRLKQFDHILRVDDGLDYRIPTVSVDKSYWVIDSHLRPDFYLSQLSQYQHVFVAQKSDHVKWNRRGVSSHWLPVACCDTTHKDFKLRRDIDVAFIGNTDIRDRPCCLRSILGLNISTYIGHAFFDEMAEVYSRAKIVFNRSVRNDLNMRAFEALASGALLLSDVSTNGGITDVLDDGTHFVGYRDIDEIADFVSNILDHPDRYESIRTAGQDLVRCHHTYFHRATQLLSVAVPSYLNPHSHNVALPQSATTSPIRSGDRQLTPDHKGKNELISACILTCHRHDNIKFILNSLLRSGMIDDITIWNNNCDHRLSIDHPQITVINSSFNYMRYGRFLGAAQAKHDRVYVQDDDCICYNIRPLVTESALTDSAILSGVKKTHRGVIHDNGEGHSDMSMLGWGAIIPKTALSYLNTYVDYFGVDDICLREADRLVTILARGSTEERTSIIGDLPGAEDGTALSTMESHAGYRNVAIERAHQLAAMSPKSTITPDLLPADTQDSCEQKEEHYYSFPRPDIQRMMPDSVRRVLDIGCGDGTLGAAIKREHGAHVVGVEIQEGIGQIAKAQLDDVIIGNIEMMSPAYAFVERFDCVIAGDVLEHLHDPTALLRRIRDWISPAGHLIVSIPNFRQDASIKMLDSGDWIYRDAGLFDNTHLHFLSANSWEATFRFAGFNVDARMAIPNPGYSHWVSLNRPTHIGIGGVRIEAKDASHVESFFFEQVLFRLTAPAPKRPPSAKALESRPRNVRIGAIIAIGNRSPDRLERVLSSYKHQTHPITCGVCVDLGSPPEIKDNYHNICRKYGWQFCDDYPSIGKAVNLSRAYNYAVSQLPLEVDIVFKGEADVILHPETMRHSTHATEPNMIIHRCANGPEYTEYGPELSREDLEDIFVDVSALPEFPGEGVQAFPYDWFIDSGGYDNAYTYWGYEDCDLRYRAEKTLKVTHIKDACGIHLFHERRIARNTATANALYYGISKHLNRPIRNGGWGFAVGNTRQPPSLMTGLSVGIHSFMRPRSLIRLIESCTTQYPDVPILIAEDWGLSYDESSEARMILQMIHETPNIQLINLPFDSGHATVTGVLLHASATEFMLVLDDDMELTGASNLYQALGAFEQNRDIAAVGLRCITAQKASPVPNALTGMLKREADTIHALPIRDSDREVRQVDILTGPTIWRCRAAREVEYVGRTDASRYDLYLQLKYDTSWDVWYDPRSVVLCHSEDGKYKRATAYPDLNEEWMRWLAGKWSAKKIVTHGEVTMEIVCQ